MSDTATLVEEVVASAKKQSDERVQVLEEELAKAESDLAAADAKAAAFYKTLITKPGFAERFRELKTQMVDLLCQGSMTEAEFDLWEELNSIFAGVVRQDLRSRSGG